MAELWDKVPSVVLHEIYSLLPIKDKVNASAVCRHWRHVFYQSVVWENLNFRIKTEDEDSVNRTLLLTSCFSNKFRNTRISFDSTDKFCVEIMIEVLEKISKNFHLTSLILRPNHCNLGIDEEQQFKKRVVDPILAIIRNSRKLETLDTGGAEDLSLYAPDLLRLLAVHHSSSLKHLSVASFKTTPCNYMLTTNLEAKLFLPFRALKELSIDYDYVNDDMLQALSCQGRVGLDDFSVNVHGIDESHPGTSNLAWSHFTAHNPNCNLHLNLLFSEEAVYELCSGLLQPSMPLTHFKALFCERVSMDALRILNEWYCLCLRSIWWVDCSSKNEHATLCWNTDPHPLVMAAWRCAQLEEIVFFGYDQMDSTILGIARLRGEKLKRFEISEQSIFLDDFIYGENGMGQLAEEVSASLERIWAPLKSPDLPPTLTTMSALETAIQFAMPILQ